MMLTPIIYNTPLPTDYFKDIYSEIRGMKERFKERFELEHYIGESENPADYNCDGYHKYLILTPLITDPEGDAIYAKQTGNTIVPYIKRGSNIEPLVSVVIYGISDVYYFIDPISFMANQNKTVDYYVSPVLGTRAEGSCWNLTGEPTSLEQGIMPDDTVIYMRAYKKLSDNTTIVYSRNQLVFKLFPDGYNWLPSSSTWFQDVGNGYFFYILKSDNTKGLMFNLVGGGIPFINSISITQAQWDQAGTSEGLNFSSKIFFFRGSMISEDSNRQYFQTRIKSEKSRVEYQ